MAETYEPNAGGLVTMQSAQQSGMNIGAAAAQGADIGNQLQAAQQRQQMLQQQMQANHLAMQDHVVNDVKDLSTMDPSSPIFKYKIPATVSKLNALGIPVTEDAFKATLGDDDQRAKIRAAATNMSSLDPQTRMQAQGDWGKIFGTDDMLSAGDKGMEIASKYAASQNKVGNTYEAQAKGIRDSVSKINQKWDTSQSFADTAKDILKNWSNFKTGQGEVALKDAYNKAMSGGAPRSFTLAMMDNNRSVGNKLDGYFEKLDSGIKLQPDERKDMLSGLNLMAEDNNSKRDMEISPYHSAAQGVLDRSSASGGSIKAGDMVPPDQWNRLQDQKDKMTFNKDTGKYETNPGAPSSPTAKQKPKPSSTQFNPYKPGDNSGRDSFLKSMISGGHSINEVNQVLSKYKMRIDQSDFDKLKSGGQ